MATAALACRKALEDATKKSPQRNIESDGILPDLRHRGIKSDHNDGNAFDLTHDPANGIDCAVLSRLVMNDKRVKYIIYARKIWSKERASEGWRNYTGENPHVKHMHVSINSDSRDDLSPWPWTPGIDVEEEKRDTKPLPPPYPGRVVAPVDAIKAFQRYQGLKEDGIVGFRTWTALFKS